MAHEAGLHHLSDRAHYILDPVPVADACGTVEVDVVGAKAAQRVREEVLDRVGPQVLGQEVSHRVSLHAELHREDDLVAIAAPQGFADEQLVVPRPIEVTGVDEGHARIQRGAQGGDALVVVSGSVEIGHAHGAEADGGDSGTRSPERTVLHGLGHCSNPHADSLAAMRSATMIVVTLVGTDGTSGRIEASTTRSASMPQTLPQASTTAVRSVGAPIGTVDVGCR